MEDIGGEPVQPATPRPGWRRLVPRSLVARLVAGVVALVVVVVLTTAIGTYFALRAFLFTRLDQQVRSTLAQNPQILEQTQDVPTTRPRAPQRVWWLLITAGVAAEHPPDQDTGTDALQLTPRLLNQLIADARGGHEPIRVITTVSGERVRVASRTTGPPAAQFVFVVGLSQSEVERTLRRLVELELIIGASAIVLALGASRYLIQFSLRRLHRVTRTAQEVAAELSPEGTGLDRRVPVDEPGTEMGQLADSMNTLLAAVETQFAARIESEERMRRFLADASHELRTPLTSIRGFAELARMRREESQNGPGPVDPDGPDDLDRIEAEGTRMSRLVDDLLLLARGDQGNLPERLAVSVVEMIEDAVSGVRAAYPERRLDVLVPEDLRVVGDYDQLVRAVRNLVSNAAAYTRPSGRITVRAERARGGVTVAVTDEGPGLSPQQAAHAFERFWRADEARNRAYGGSGLGLSIVESIVRSHGGTVGFVSSVERGSTVSLWLPDGTDL